MRSLKDTESSALAGSDDGGEGSERKEDRWDSILFQSWSERFFAIGLYIAKIHWTVGVCVAFRALYVKGGYGGWISSGVKRD